MIDKRSIWKCSALVGLMLATLALCWVFPNAATDPQTGMWLRLPESIPGYHSKRVEPGKLELKWLPPDTGILKRYYMPVDSKSKYEGIFATLILSGNDPRSLHKPEVCLDGQGWRIRKRELVTLKVNGRDLEVMDFTVAMDQKLESGELVRQDAHYVYWWIGKTRTTARDWDRIIYSDLDNLIRNVNNRWGYPSVMVYVDPSREKEAAHKEAQERAYHFIRNYAPVFQKSLADPPASSGSPAP